ncbi:Uncharacterised protein [uncultured archaeon]|nr:Uncharacterised protein [uncultured archaeon]
MDIKLFHDLSPQELGSNYFKGIDGFFMSPIWWLLKPKAYDFVTNIWQKGGIKKAYNIPDDVLYIQGADRILERPKDVKEGEPYQMFIRPTISALKEAVCLNPDIIQLLDVPLDDNDTEKKIVEKIAINHDIVERSAKWLIENKYRSSDRYKNGIHKFSKFMLLGVCHGDLPDIYAEEAKFMKDHCEIIGIPIAGLLSRVKGLDMRQRYDYVFQVVGKVLDEVGNTRPLQMMGYGLSKITELSRIVGLAKKYDATIWFESSTIIRSSVHARKLLSINPLTDDIDYVNIARVEGADDMSPQEIFVENNQTLKGIITQTLKHASL